MARALDARCLTLYIKCFLPKGMKMCKKLNATVASTARGHIEYLERKENHAAIHGTILTIHGAMGGYEQSDILGKAVGPEGYRYIAVSRPGYLQTPLKGNESPEAQADLLAALLDELGIQKAIIMAISGADIPLYTLPCVIQSAARH